MVAALVAAIPAFQAGDGLSFYSGSDILPTDFCENPLTRIMSHGHSSCMAFWKAENSIKVTHLILEYRSLILKSLVILLYKSEFVLI